MLTSAAQALNGFSAMAKLLVLLAEGRVGVKIPLSQVLLDLVEETVSQSRSVKR